MDEYQSLNHTQWECKYHVVFIPKYRRKALFGELRGDVPSVVEIRWRSGSFLRGPLIGFNGVVSA